MQKSAILTKSSDFLSFICSEGTLVKHITQDLSSAVQMYDTFRFTFVVVIVTS
jgi:hypothetical protein